MILYSVISIVISLVLIYSSFQMYKEKQVIQAITIDILSSCLIGLSILGFLLEEEYHKYLIFTMLGIVVVLIFVYYLSNKNNPNKRK